MVEQLLAGAFDDVVRHAKDLQTSNKFFRLLGTHCNSWNTNKLRGGSETMVTIPTCTGFSPSDFLPDSRKKLREPSLADYVLRTLYFKLVLLSKYEMS